MTYTTLSYFRPNKELATFIAALALERNQNIDITNFQEKINTFKEGFARIYDLASRKFKTAIEEIDKTIDYP